MTLSRRSVLLGACGLGAGAAVVAGGLRAASPGSVTGHADAGAASGGTVPRSYLAAADWLWEPVRDDPVLDPRSAEMVFHLQGGLHVACMRSFGVTLRGPQDVTSATPRYRVAFSKTGVWGGDPFDGDTMPVPDGTPVPPGSDGHVAVADPVRDTLYSLWQAQRSADGWTASWGAKVPLQGDGRERSGTSSTGSRLSRMAGVVRVGEIAARHIPHALFFSTDMAAPAADYRYPAGQSDGRNMADVPAPIPEGARVQLDPSIDLAAMTELTTLELVVARALQTHGAYCGDNGAARMGFLFEYEQGEAPGPTYRVAGAPWDYFDMSRIPWHRLRVLNSWDGR